MLGVIIGGLTASTTSMVMIILDDRPWQRQSTLEQLRFEQTRREKIFRENLKKIFEGNY